MHPKWDDINRFMAYVKEQPDGAAKLKQYPILQASDDKSWLRPCQLCVDLPIEETGLCEYTRLIVSPTSYPPVNARRAISHTYAALYNVGGFAEFLTSVGCMTQLEIREVPCHRYSEAQANEHFSHIRWWAGNPVNKDYSIDGLPKLGNNVVLWKQVWKAICTSQKDWWEAKFQPNKKSSLKCFPSYLARYLREIEWVPQTIEHGLEFLKPADASCDRLPPGFKWDASYPWLKVIGFGEGKLPLAVPEVSDEQAKKLGFANHNTFNKLRKLAGMLREEELDELIKQGESPKPEFPSRPVADHARRQTLKNEQHEDQPDKEYEVRARSVRLTRDYLAAKAYLRSMYTTDDGDVVCQLCQESLNKASFRKLDGKPYFVAVEFICASVKDVPENCLLLCPLCAAKFKELVKSRYGEQDSQEPAFMKTLLDLALEQTQEAELVINVAMHDKVESLTFVEKHWSDLQVIAAKASPVPAVR